MAKPDGFTLRQRLAAAVIGAALLGGAALFYFRPVVVHAQDNLTPGMLFGPILVDKGQHLELCSSYLGSASLTVFAHFRNLNTGESSPIQEVPVASGGGGCATYSGQGHIVGLTRGDGPAADWVSPSNALIGTMSLVNDGNKRVQAAVLGVPKMWVRWL